jgi:hypothetical protein
LCSTQRSGDFVDGADNCSPDEIEEVEAHGFGRGTRRTACAASALLERSRSWRRKRRLPPRDAAAHRTIRPTSAADCAAGRSAALEGIEPNGHVAADHRDLLEPMAAARDILAELASSTEAGYVRPVELARVHVALGDHAHARSTSWSVPSSWGRRRSCWSMSSRRSAV